MLFPERELANEFWLFVFQQALDPRGSGLGRRPHCNALDKHEIERTGTKFRLEGVDGISEEDFDFVAEGEVDRPRLYRTLQEALIAFLIYWQETATRFPVTYDIWLRAVVLVICDAQRNPAWLRLEGCDLSRDGEPREFKHSVAISDDWDCLRREVYDYVVQAFRNSGVS